MIHAKTSIVCSDCGVFLGRTAKPIVRDMALTADLFENFDPPLVDGSLMACKYCGAGWCLFKGDPPMLSIHTEKGWLNGDGLSHT